ncbi:hypothetical protein [Microscilla marina]|nr:hypothetical protein [Microscilla marina]
MKKGTIIRMFVWALATICMISTAAKAQTPQPKLTVLNIAVEGLHLSPKQAGNMVRRELAKIAKYEVLDKYDVMYLINKHGLKIDNCYGKICLLDVAKVIGSDKMLTGSIERFQKTITITLRLIDVKSKSVEKVEIKEFLHLPEHLKTMVTLSIRKIFGLPNNKEVVASLSERNKMENAINTPAADMLKLGGPRMGFTMFTGDLANQLAQPEYEGGYDAIPLMFQFGYQFETKYLNEGNFQALVEFIPMVTGIDQGLFIPSLTILNGLRSNKSGWEFAFGPTISLTQQAEGYYQNGAWVKLNDTDDRTQINQNIVTRLDSRGEYQINTGFVFAFGKTLRSGKLNIPINAYVVPHREGIRLGVSFGFNSRKNKY